METLRLEPISRIDGEIHLPGSKSLSNRALLLAAMAEGVTEITNLLDSDDVRHMLNALRELGVKFELSSDGTHCVVTGLGGVLTDGGKHELFLGNAGTAMRPLTAALCMGRGEFTMTGEPRMEERPIDALVDALRQGGCRIDYLKAEGYPPLRIHADGFCGGRIEIDGSISSQFLTALLMAAPLARQDVEIHIVGELVSKPYIDITLDAMRKFGIEVENADYRVFKIAAGRKYQSPGKFLVEGDASSASYFLAAAAIKGGRVTVHGIGKASIQGDIHFADVLEKMGARVEWADDSITVVRGELNAVDMDMNHIPDAAMTIATTALFAKGTTAIRNIYNWRVKETDRIAAMATELRKVGAQVVEGRDFIEITPPAVLEHGVIDTYNDHRMAMCFSLLALDPASVTINDPGCTAKTFPDYFEKLGSVSVRSSDNENFMKRVISIDGPAASGKSSAAKRLAKQLGWGFVNSGEFYRSVTWAMLRSGVDIDTPSAIIDATRQLKLGGEIVDGLSRVLVDGAVVPVDELSTAEVNDAVSKVARVPEVREMVVSRLRALAEAEPVVMEGRDIGSVVFPASRYKFYVDASEEVRQQRRAAQGLTDQISQRDKADSQRKSSPLKIPDGAVVVDSSEMSLEEVVATIVTRLAEAGFELPQ